MTTSTAAAAAAVDRHLIIVVVTAGQSHGHFSAVQAWNRASHS